jgi:MotA/TolQ/ExbB proton channel family
MPLRRFARSAIADIRVALRPGAGKRLPVQQPIPGARHEFLRPHYRDHVADPAGKCPRDRMPPVLSVQRGTKPIAGGVRDANAALREGRFSHVVRLAGRKRRSPTATLVAAGRMAFAAVPQHFTVAEAAGAAERAFRRTCGALGAALMPGLGTLSTIASSAPFLGLLGTVFGILGALRGTVMQRAAAMTTVASYLAESLVTTAIGMVVAIAAV